MIEYLKTLYNYNAWANNRILGTCAGLSASELLQGGGASFDSVRDTLVHTMSAQWIWLSRWQGTSPEAMFAPGDFPDLPSIHGRWAEIEKDTERFLAGLDAHQLDGEYLRQHTG